MWKSPIIVACLVLLVIFAQGGFAQQSQSPPGEANEYMFQNSVESLARHLDNPERDEWQKPNLVISRLGDLQNKTVMDLGAGSGYFTLKLATKAAKVIAADVDERFQDVIRKKLLDPAYSKLKYKVELRKVPFDNPGLKDQEVDAVLLVDTYHHIENRVGYFQKLLKGLKPHGKLVVVDYMLGNHFRPPDSHKVGLDVVKRELSQVAFSTTAIDTTSLPYQYILVAGK